MVNIMTLDRKLIRNGNSWVLSVNLTLLALLDIDPEVNMVKYTIENNKLIITKSDKLIEKET